MRPDRPVDDPAELQLADRCVVAKGDFMALPFRDGTFDGAYPIEATCHAPDRVGVFAEVLRVLQPGAVFAGYEWLLTDAYDPTNEEHRRVIHDVEEGDALPSLGPARHIDAALAAAGFVDVRCEDVAPTAELPWWRALTGRDVSGFARSTVGRAVTHNAVNKAADALVRAGELGIFTPMYLHVARKPR